jgi:hypothetical protein
MSRKNLTKIILSLGKRTPFKKYPAGGMAKRNSAHTFASDFY